MSHPNRVQPGVPTGGQFAATQRAESDVELSVEPTGVLPDDLAASLKEATAARAAADEHEQRLAMKAAASYVRSVHPTAARIILTDLGDDNAYEETHFKVDSIVDAEDNVLAEGNNDDALDNIVGFLSDVGNGDSVVPWNGGDEAPWLGAGSGVYLSGYSYIPIDEALAYDHANGAPSAADRNQFPMADWRYEVGNGDTSLGYDGWLRIKVLLAAAAEDADGEDADGEDADEFDHRYNSAPFCGKCSGPCQMPHTDALTDDEQLAVDDLIIDVASRAASNEVNSEGADFDSAHDTSDRLASDINNGGPSAQFAFLVEQLGPDAAHAAMRGAIGRPWTTARQVSAASFMSGDDQRAIAKQAREMADEQRERY